MRHQHPNKRCIWPDEVIPVKSSPSTKTNKTQPPRKEIQKDRCDTWGPANESNFIPRQWNAWSWCPNRKDPRKGQSTQKEAQMFHKATEELEREMIKCQTASPAKKETEHRPHHKTIKSPPFLHWSKQRKWGRANWKSPVLYSFLTRIPSKPTPTTSLFWWSS